MGFRIETATGRSVAIRAQKKQGAPTTVDLEVLLGEVGGKRAKWLRDQTDRTLTDRVRKPVAAAESVADLHAALQPVIDAAATPDLVPAGAVVWMPHEVIRTKLLATAPRDVEELLPQLKPRAHEIAELAIRRLRERGEREAADLEETLRCQRERIVEELDRHEGQYAQITLDFDDDERHQLQTNMRYWRTRLDQFDRDLKHEPGRIRAFYAVQAQRVEPVGLVHLWPETN